VRLRKKLLIGISASLALSLLVAFSVIWSTAYSLLDLHFTKTDLTKVDLEEALQDIKWTQEYERGVFDCSNMAALLSEILEEKGFNCHIACDNEHSWVLARTKEGTQIVEAITRSLGDDSRSFWIVLDPTLASLLEPAGFGYTDTQYRDGDKSIPSAPKLDSESSKMSFISGLPYLY